MPLSINDQSVRSILKFFFTFIVCCVLEGGAPVSGAHVCVQEHMHETEDSF